MTREEDIAIVSHVWGQMYSCTCYTISVQAASFSVGKAWCLNLLSRGSAALRAPCSGHRLPAIWENVGLAWELKPHRYFASIQSAPTHKLMCSLPFAPPWGHCPVLIGKPVPLRLDPPAIDVENAWQFQNTGHGAKLWRVSAVSHPRGALHERTEVEINCATLCVYVFLESLNSAPGY